MSSRKRMGQKIEALGPSRRCAIALLVAVVALNVGLASAALFSDEVDGGGEVVYNPTDPLDVRRTGQGSNGIAFRVFNYQTINLGSLVVEARSPPAVGGDVGPLVTATFESTGTNMFFTGTSFRGVRPADGSITGEPCRVLIKSTAPASNVIVRSATFTECGLDIQIDAGKILIEDTSMTLHHMGGANASAAIRILPGVNAGGEGLAVSVTIQRVNITVSNTGVTNIDAHSPNVLPAVELAEAQTFFNFTDNTVAVTADAGTTVPHLTGFLAPLMRVVTGHAITARNTFVMRRDCDPVAPTNISAVVVDSRSSSFRTTQMFLDVRIEQNTITVQQPVDGAAGEACTNIDAGAMGIAYHPDSIGQYFRMHQHSVYSVSGNTIDAVASVAAGYVLGGRWELFDHSAFVIEDNVVTARGSVAAAGFYLNFNKDSHFFNMYEESAITLGNNTVTASSEVRAHGIYVTTLHQRPSSGPVTMRDNTIVLHNESIVPGVRVLPPDAPLPFHRGIVRYLGIISPSPGPFIVERNTISSTDAHPRAGTVAQWHCALDVYIATNEISITVDDNVITGDFGYSMAWIQFGMTRVTPAPLRTIRRNVLSGVVALPQFVQATLLVEDNVMTVPSSVTVPISAACFYSDYNVNEPVLVRIANNSVRDCRFVARFWRNNFGTFGYGDNGNVEVVDNVGHNVGILSWVRHNLRGTIVATGNNVSTFVLGGDAFSLSSTKLLGNSSMTLNNNEIFVGDACTRVVLYGVWETGAGASFNFSENRITVRTDVNFDLVAQLSSGHFITTGEPYTINAINNVIDIGRAGSPFTNRHVYLFRFYEAEHRSQLTHPIIVDVSGNRVDISRVVAENNQDFEFFTCVADAPYVTIRNNVINVTAEAGMLAAWRLRHVIALMGLPRQWDISGNTIFGAETIEAPFLVQTSKPLNQPEFLRDAWDLTDGPPGESRYIYITNNRVPAFNAPALILPPIRFSLAAVIIRGNHFAMRRSTDQHYPIIRIASVVANATPLVVANRSILLIADNVVEGASGPLLEVMDGNCPLLIANGSRVTVRNNTLVDPQPFSTAEPVGTIRALLASVAVLQLEGDEPLLKSQDNRIVGSADDGSGGGLAVAVHVEPSKSPDLAAVLIRNLSATAISPTSPNMKVCLNIVGDVFEIANATFNGAVTAQETRMALLRLDHVSISSQMEQPLVRVDGVSVRVAVTGASTVPASTRTINWATVLVTGSFVVEGPPTPMLRHLFGLARNRIRFAPAADWASFVEPVISSDRVTIRHEHVHLRLAHQPDGTPLALANRTFELLFNVVLNATGVVRPPEFVPAAVPVTIDANAVVHCSNAVFRPMIDTGAGSRAALPLSLDVASGGRLPQAFVSSSLDVAPVLGTLFENASTVDCPTGTATFTASVPPTPTQTQTLTASVSAGTASSTQTTTQSSSLSGSAGTTTATRSGVTESQTPSVSVTSTVSVSPSVTDPTRSTSASITATLSVSSSVTDPTRSITRPTASQSRPSPSLSDESRTESTSFAVTDTAASPTLSVSESLADTSSRTPTVPTASRSGPSATETESATIQVCSIPEVNVTVDTIAARSFIGGRTVSFELTLGGGNAAMPPPLLNSTFGTATVSNYSSDFKWMTVVLSPPDDEYVSPYAKYPPIVLSMAGDHLVCRMPSDEAANVSIPMTFEAPPIPKDVQTSVGATSAISAMGTTTSSGQISRMDIVVALGLCAFELEEPMDTMLSPTGWAFTSGGEELAPARGAIIGNLAIVAGWFVLAVVIALVLTAAKVAPTVKEGLRLVHFPGIGAPVALLLLPGTASATTTMVVHGHMSSVFDGGFAAFGVLQMTVFTLAMCSMATVSFVCVLVDRYVPAKTEDESALRRTFGWRLFTTAFQSKRKWVVDADKQMRRQEGAAAGQWREWVSSAVVAEATTDRAAAAAAAEPLLDGSDEAASAAPTDAEDGGARDPLLADPGLPGFNFKAKYGPAFIDFALPIYVVAETLVAVVLGIIDGVKLTWFCAPGIYAACGIQLLLLASQIVLRPGMSAALNFFLIVPSACSTFAAGAAVAARFELAPGALTWFGWSSWMALGANGVIVLKLAWDLIALFLWFKYHQAAVTSELRGFREAFIARMKHGPATTHLADHGEPLPALEDDVATVGDVEAAAVLQGREKEEQKQKQAEHEQNERLARELVEEDFVGGDPSVPRGASPASSTDGHSTDSVLVKLLDGTHRRYKAPQPVLVKNAEVDLSFIDDLLGPSAAAEHAAVRVELDELDELGPTPAVPVLMRNRPSTVAPSISRDFTVDDLQGDRLRAIRYEDI